MKQHQRVARKLVHQGNLLTFYEDSIALPNGKVALWDYLHHKGAAAILPIDQDGSVLMIRQYRNAIDRDTLEIPAGGLNPGESFQVCAERELEEETGYRAGKTTHLVDFYTTCAYCDEKIGIYVATDLIQTKQHLDEDEFLNVEKYEISELSALVFNGTIQDSKTIIAILAYQNQKNHLK